jgi:hypothetical protein
LFLKKKRNSKKLNSKKKPQFKSVFCNINSKPQFKNPNSKTPIQKPQFKSGFSNLNSKSVFFLIPSYLRVEDIAVAYMALEKSRSMTSYIELFMATLKDHIYVVDSAMVETPGYWVIRVSKKDMLIRIVSTANPNFGDGLCEKIYTLLIKTQFHGESCIKWEPFTDPTSNQTADYFMVSKRWIASVMGTVEAAIVDALETMSAKDSNTRVFNDYVDETTRVFPTTVRSSLMSPEAHGAVRFDELKLFSASQIKHAFCLLKERVDPVSGVPMIAMPSGEIGAALYRPATALSAVPSVLSAPPHHPSKIRTNVELPLLVSPSLWTSRASARTEGKDAVTQFIEKLFLIAGGYEGKHITAGGTGGDDHFYIKPGGTCRLVVLNPHYKPSAFSIYGDTAAVGHSDELFPSDTREIVLTESSYFEAHVARLATKRVPTSPAILAVFAEAHGTTNPFK